MVALVPTAAANPIRLKTGIHQAVTWGLAPVEPQKHSTTKTKQCLKKTPKKPINSNNNNHGNHIDDTAGFPMGEDFIGHNEPADRKGEYQMQGMQIRFREVKHVRIAASGNLNKSDDRC